MYNMLTNYPILTTAYVDIIVLILQVQKNPLRARKVQ